MTARILSRDEIEDLLTKGEIRRPEEIRNHASHYIAPGRKFQAGSDIDRKVKK